LQLLQKLDVIDTEGAAIIYNRLIGLCSNSIELADNLILERVHMPIWSFNMDQLKAIALGNVITSPSQESSYSLQDTLITLKKLQTLAIHENMSEMEIQSRSDEAFAVIETLSSAICADILFLWMMSLIAKDASVIISLEPQPNPQQQQQQQNLHQYKQISLSDAPAYRIALLPQGITAGLLSPIDSTDNSNLPSFAFSVGVIDVGMKPLEKITKRYFEEEVLLATISEYHKQHDNDAL